MDSILFNRLKTQVIKVLGETFHTDLSKLTVIVVEYIETLPFVLESEEKLQLSVGYIEALLKEAGVSQPPEILVMISGFINRLVEASQGQLAINQQKKSINSIPLVPIDSDTASVTGKKKGGLFGKSTK
jgi:hypothetical protein